MSILLSIVVRGGCKPTYNWEGRFLWSMLGQEQFWDRWRCQIWNGATSWILKVKTTIGRITQPGEFLWLSRCRESSLNSTGHTTYTVYIYICIYNKKTRINPILQPSLKRAAISRLQTPTRYLQLPVQWTGSFLTQLLLPGHPKMTGGEISSVRMIRPCSRDAAWWHQESLQQT